MRPTAPAPGPARAAAGEVSSKAMRIWKPEAYKQRVRELFDRRAPTYDDNPKYHVKIASRCLHVRPKESALLLDYILLCAELKPLPQYARLEEGCRVLDLACGTGHVALEACKAVGPGGSVVGLDISRPMLCQAEEKARARGLKNVSFIVGDAEEHDFAPASFDRILSANAVPYLQDYSASFRRFRSWLAPGGRFIFSTPQAPMFLATDTLNELVLDMFGIAMCDAAGEVGNEETVGKLLREAGFADVQVNPESDTYINTMSPAGFAERMWKQVESFPMCPLDQMLDREQLEQLRAAYLPLVTKQGEAMQQGPDIVNHFLGFYVVAEA